GTLKLRNRQEARFKVPVPQLYCMGLVKTYVMSLGAYYGEKRVRVYTNIYTFLFNIDAVSSQLLLYG
ncbi:hypothetical protein ACUC9R_25400, partial [Escherichia coli]